MLKELEYNVNIYYELYNNLNNKIIVRTFIMI
jgi:hypothetical protein